MRQEKMNMPKIKICGLSRPEDITYINEAKPDYCGFIIDVPKSRRNVSISKVRELVQNLESQICPVGVFVNKDCGEVAQLLNEGTIQIAQLHGQEDDAKAIFGVLGGHAYSKDYLISDNTGSSPNSGGSEDIVKYMKDERYRQAYNTKDKIIDLPIDCSSAHSISKRRTSLGDLDSI